MTTLDEVMKFEDVEELPNPEVDKRIAQSQENKDLLTSLVNHAGWKYLERVAKAQIEIRKNKIFLEPLSSLNDAVGQEFLKGEATGMNTLLKLPYVLIDEAETVATSLIKARDDHADDEETEGDEGEEG